MAGAVSFVTGWALIEFANANDESSALGAVLFLAAIPLVILTAYYTARAAARS